MDYKGKENALQEVWRELSVDALLLSRIRRQGNDLSMSVE